MHERIVEIITRVLNELKQNKKIDEIDIKGLEKSGYTNSEISAAFSWLVDKLEFSNDLFTTDKESGNSFRILHEAEQDLFTEEAWGELIQMHSIGMLSSSHIETIIERALISGIFKINSEILKTYVASIIFKAVPNNVPGSRIMLKGNDTIN